MRYTLPVILLMLFAVGAKAQISASFQPQDSSTFKSALGVNNKRLQFYEVEICNGGPTSTVVHSGLVLAAAQKAGVPTISPLLVSSIIRSTDNKNWLTISTDVFRGAAFVGTILMGSKVVAASPGVQTAIPLVAQFVPAAVSFLSAKKPDLSGLESQFLSGLLEVGPNSCQSRLLLATAVAGAPAVSTEVSIGGSSGQATGTGVR